MLGLLQILRQVALLDRESRSPHGLSSTIEEGGMLVRKVHGEAILLVNKAAIHGRTLPYLESLASIARYIFLIEIQEEAYQYKEFPFDRNDLSSTSNFFTMYLA